LCCKGARLYWEDNSGLYGNINMTKYAAISLDRLEEIQQHADDTREE